MNVLPEDDYFYNSAPKLPVSRRKWISNTQSILWNYSANKTKLGLNFTKVCYSYFRFIKFFSKSHQNACTTRIDPPLS